MKISQETLNTVAKAIYRQRSGDWNLIRWSDDARIGEAYRSDAKIAIAAFLESKEMKAVIESALDALIHLGKDFPSGAVDEPIYLALKSALAPFQSNDTKDAV